MYRITEVHRERYLATCEGKEIFCILSGNLRYQEEYPVVGDYVEVIENPFGDSLIREILPRKTIFCRPDRNGHADGYVKTMQVQPLIANYDYAFIITSLNHDFSLARIARYASMVTSGGATPVAVLTKADLCPDIPKMESQVKSLSENLQVVSVSSYTGFGLDRLKSYFIPGTTIALLGSSGAGKSTLINTLAGREIMRVSEIREEDSKGRHTTTHRQMIELNDVFFIDTPGLRELGVIDAEEGISETFSDISALAEQCAFSDCSHRSEPDCAIQRALADGSLSRERWEMYCRLDAENNWSKSMKAKKMVDIALKRRTIGKNRTNRNF